MAAERLHGNDTTVPLLAKGKTATGRAWVYVRDDRPFGGCDPPAALFHYSRDRRVNHPQAHLAGFAGILQADAYCGYNALFGAERQPGAIHQALCWAHARRKQFELADIASTRRGKTAVALSPLALDAIRRIDRLCDFERGITGRTAEERLAMRRELSTPVVAELEGWMKHERAKLSRN